MATFHNPNLRAQHSDSNENAGANAHPLLLIIALILLTIFSIQHFKPLQQTSVSPGVSTTATAQTIVPTTSTKPEQPVQHSWVSIIADPLYRWLRFLHGKLGESANSWGWAIVLFTVFINLCLLPFRLAIMRSSVKMRRIQPKVESIKKRYAHLKMRDPKQAEMQSEIMALYKLEGVNMFGGCLLQLIPMPLLYAMYRMLANAGELRYAHWLWISDLAAPDPLHVLPVVIVISGFLAQWSMPQASMDATQRRMMLFVMPVFMGVMLWRFAAGLSLYWTTGNLVSLGVQLIFNQCCAGKEKAIHA